MPGDRYRMLGRNQPGGDWLQIMVPSTQPQLRWSPPTAGRSPRRHRRPAVGAAAFFDDAIAAGDDPSPPPPPLAALDRGVLEVCGPWGSRPSARFRGDARSARARARGGGSHEGLDRSVRGGKVPLRRFKDELTVWFDASGFAHRCGEPHSDQLGGMHYRGRYRPPGAGHRRADVCCRVPGHRARAAGLHRRRALSPARRRPTPEPPAPRATPTTWEPATCCSPRPRPIANSDGSAMRRCALEEIAAPGRRCLPAVVVRGDAIRTFYLDLRPPATAAASGQLRLRRVERTPGGLNVAAIGDCPTPSIKPPGVAATVVAISMTARSPSRREHSAISPWRGWP